MRVVIQRVKSVNVYYQDNIIAQINKGILLYIGIKRDEKTSSVDWLIDRLRSIKEEDDDILCLSQFTLFGELKGSKPSFHNAEKTEIAEKYFYETVDRIREYFNCKVKNGLFGKNLQIEIEGDKIITEYLNNEEINK